MDKETLVSDCLRASDTKMIHLVWKATGRTLKPGMTLTRIKTEFVTWVLYQNDEGYDLDQAWSGWWPTYIKDLMPNFIRARI